MKDTNSFSESLCMLKGDEAYMAIELLVLTSCLLLATVTYKIGYDKGYSTGLDTATSILSLEVMRRRPSTKGVKEHE